MSIGEDWFTLLESAFENAPIGKALVDADGRYLRVNRSLCRLLGRSAEELTGGLTFADVTHPDDVEHDRESQRQLLAGEVATYQLEKRYVLPDGRWRWGGVHASLATDEQGRPIYIAQDGRPKYVIRQVEDITARKEAETALAAANEELARSNERLNEFVYVASHDLSEPLRVVSGFAELLADQYGESLGADAGQFVEYIRSGVDRMQALIRDLLAYSRVGTAARPWEEVDLGAVVADTVTVLDGTVRDAGAKVEVGPLPTLTADPVQMGQLFQNLISNAVKFRRPGVAPVVAVSAEPAAVGWQVSVVDNGIGIDEKFREKVFNMFERLHSRDEFPGTGIGLAICAKIVERHGGRIWVETGADDGSVFRFTLPATATGPP